MPVAKKGFDAQLAQEGHHYLRLHHVDEDRLTSKFSKEEDGKSAVWYWIFESRHKDEHGVAQTVRHMTPAELTPNNGQMKFWSMLMPKVDFEHQSGNTDQVCGKWFEAEIRHERKGEKTYANIVFIKPWVKTQAAVPAPTPAVTAAPPPPAKTTPRPAVVAAPEPDDDLDDGPEDTERDPFSDEDPGP